MPSPSDADNESYLELKKESEKTGKTVQQIIKEINEKEGVIYSQKTPEEARKEVMKTLAENTFKITPNKQEDSNE